MPIIAGNFETRISGGAANTVGNASLGGIKSSTNASASIDALFDPTSAAEAVAGTVEYRCVYLHNANAADTMTNLVAFVSANTPLAGTTIDIGVGTAAINATEQTIVNETTAPTGVVFSAPIDGNTGLVMGNIPFGQHKSLWLRRTVTAGSGSSPNDTFTLGYRCETA